MGMLDILANYADAPRPPPPHIFDDFEAVAHEAPQDTIEEGLEEAFRSDETPPFEQMVGQLYERSDDDQRAGLLNQLFGAAGPGLLGGLAGGALGDLFRGQSGRVDRDVARRVDARQVETMAAQAARQNPGIIQAISRFYAQHPQLVRNLGSAALAIAMRRMSHRRRF